MVSGRQMTKEYICYKGEDFVMIGTAREISEQTGVSVEHVYWLAYARRVRRRKNPGKNGGWIVVPLEEEDEDETD